MSTTSLSITDRHRQRMIIRRRRTNFLYVAGLSIFAFGWLIPAIWTISTSLRPELDIQRNLVMLIPDRITLENWQYLLQSSMIPRWFLNSLIVSVSAMILQLFVCSMAAYAFARLKFKGKRFLFIVVLAGLLVPGQVTFIPIYLLFAELKLHNTYTALILPHIASAFAVFLMTQFFKGIPRDLEDAAVIDGASRFEVYWRIILPLSTPVLTALGIFIFLGTWNDYLWPLVSATDREVMTLTIGLRNVSASWGFQQFYGRIMAAAWLGALPVILFFLLFQRRIIAGIQMTSGIK